MNSTKKMLLDIVEDIVVERFTEQVLATVNLNELVDNVLSIGMLEFNLQHPNVSVREFAPLFSGTINKVIDDIVHVTIPSYELH